MKDKIKVIIIGIILIILIIIAVAFSNRKVDELQNTNVVIENTVISEDSVIVVNKDNFETEVLNSEKRVLIDFYADWCGPCNRLFPLVNKVASENKDIKVVRIDVDQNEDLMNQYNVRSIPTLVVIEKGKEINRQVGLISEESILKLINND